MLQRGLWEQVALDGNVPRVGSSAVSCGPGLPCQSSEVTGVTPSASESGPPWERSAPRWAPRRDCIDPGSHYTWN